MRRKILAHVELLRCTASIYRLVPNRPRTGLTPPGPAPTLGRPMAKPRVLGLDVGSRTIGVAVTDELGLCAHALRTLQRRGTQADVAQIGTLARTYGTRQLVVGMPYELDGKEGRRAQRVRVFVDALLSHGFMVELQDERYSTVEAERALLEADLSRARRKKVVDALAAQVILTAWLERAGSAGPAEPAGSDG